MAIRSLLPRPWLAAAVVAAIALSAHAAPRPAVDASHATMRIPKAGFSSTVVFVDLHAARDVRLVGASSAAARSVRLMTMKRQGNEVFMDPVAGVEMAAGSEKRLRTGVGQHFLFAENVRKALKPGDKVPLTLLLEEKGRRFSLVVRAEVVAPRGYSAVPQEDVH